MTINFAKSLPKREGPSDDPTPTELPWAPPGWQPNGFNEQSMMSVALRNMPKATGLVEVTNPATGQKLMVTPEIDKQLELYEKSGNSKAAQQLFMSLSGKDL